MWTGIHQRHPTEPPGYAQLYPGELERLQSSVIYPILSDTNELLGTLVVHCDKTGFIDEG